MTINSRNKACCLVLFFILLCCSQLALAVLEVRVVGDQEQALPIIVSPFATTEHDALAVDLAGIVSDDLSRTGYFSPVAGDSPDFSSAEHVIDYKNWRQKFSSEYLVLGWVIRQQDTMQIDFRLFNIYREQQLLAVRYRVGVDGLRHAGHRISDAIYQALVGRPGGFSRPILFVSETHDSQGKKNFFIHVADSDGENKQVIVRSHLPLMSPSWSPDGQQIAYVSFEHGTTEVYRQNIFSKKRQLIASFPGINSAPAWSPNSKKLALTLSKDGNSEIYLLSLADMSLTRITRHPAIDTEAAWSVDGQRLAFTSDRTGSPQIYEVDVANPAKPRRLTFNGSYNARPVYAPDGGRIALIHGSDDGYHIGVLDLDSGDIQVLTRSRFDESPSFSASGDMVLYSTLENGRSILRTVSVRGRRLWSFPRLRGEVIRDSAWAPLRSAPGRNMERPE